MTDTPRPTLLVLGGTSSIARAIANAFAAAGFAIELAARDVEAVARDARDIATRYAVPTGVTRLDVLEPGAFEQLTTGKPLPDVVACVVGFMPAQALAETDPATADTVMRTNYLAPALLLQRFANLMRERGSGTLIGISSVAGERGRASNYHYGSAKAGFTAFLSGLRARLAPHGVHVLTVKPGFVRTRMTADLKLPTSLTAEPRELGAAVLAAATRRQGTIYVRPIWFWIMAVIRCLPEAIFKRLRM